MRFFMKHRDPESDEVRPRRRAGKDSSIDQQPASGHLDEQPSWMLRTKSWKGWPATFGGRPVPDVSWGLWFVLWFFWTFVVVWLIKISVPSLHSGPPWWFGVSYLLERYMRNRALRVLAKIGITPNPHWFAILSGVVGVMIMIGMFE